MDKKIIQVAILIIGDEVLGGEVLEVNTARIISELKLSGIQVSEVRWIRDDQKEIVSAVNYLRVTYDFLFTTGGIGPTHDDITSISIAKAFGVSQELHAEASEMLRKQMQSLNCECTDTVLRMALFPVGAKLLKSPDISAPGFYIENVFVMAGVPEIMYQMLQAALKILPTGSMIMSFSMRLHAPESTVANILESLEIQSKNVSVGSYPYQQDGKWLIKVVVRSFDTKNLQLSRDLAQEMFCEQGLDFEFLSE